MAWLRHGAAPAGTGYSARRSALSVAWGRGDAHDAGRVEDGDMSRMRRLSAACAGVVAGSVLVVTPLLAGPAAAAELIQDGGFEAATGTPPNSPSWTEADSDQGSPLCPTSTCSTTSTTAPPRTGTHWARFGGVSSAAHTSSLSQAVVIPSGGSAVLTYWYRNGRVASPFTATLLVRVDGTTLKTHTEASTAQSAYSQQTVNLSAYANGASHTISFVYANHDTGDQRMAVDDISLTYTPAVTGTPTVTSTTPASPSSSTTPLVKGSAETGSTVTLYSNNTCSSSALGSGSAASFAGTGITATVPANATTTIFAKATKTGQTASACSATFVTYTHDSTKPAPVTLSATTPTSPGPSTTPAVKGTAEAGSTVRIYKTADCSGTPAATGTAAALASPGIPVSVTAGSTTTFRATAADAAGNVSACSTSTLTYVQDSAAPAMAVLTGVSPASPSTSTSPVVRGTAEAGSTVKLYTTATCTGSPVATGAAAVFASPGIATTVVLGSTTTFRATATDAAGNTSACSSTTQTYTSDLRDGGFEAATGSPAFSPDWVEADSLAGTPLCTVSTCTPGAEIAPRSGSAWVWFGGFADAGHTGSMSQTLTIPVGSVALSYWYRNSSVSAPFDAVLMVQVDGTTLRTHVEAPVADAAYAKQVVDLSQFADGASHVLTFSYLNGGEGVNNMIVDDVGLSPGSAPRTATPTVGATVPVSPSTSTTPSVTGTAEAGSTVRLFATSTCTGPVLGSGSAADFATTGITAVVPAGATTTIFARAVKAGQNDSGCSTTSARYTHLGPPDTTLTKTPKRSTRIAKRKVKVSFAFTSATAGATFQCSIDGRAFTACTSVRSYRLERGTHTFAVRAVAFGLTDASPATYTFKIKKKHRRGR